MQLFSTHSDLSSSNRPIYETPSISRLTPNIPSMTSLIDNTSYYASSNEISIEALISKMNFLHKKAWNDLKNFASDSLVPWTIQTCYYEG